MSTTSPPAFHWSNFDPRSQNAHPPLPSLPPWAANNSSRDPRVVGGGEDERHDSKDRGDDGSNEIQHNDDGSSADMTPGWRRPTSYFGSMKRLPFRSSRTSSGMDPGVKEGKNEDETLQHQHQHHQHRLPAHNQSYSEPSPSRHDRDEEEPLQHDHERATNQHDDQQEHDEIATSASMGSGDQEDADQQVITPSPDNGGAFFRPWKKMASDDGQDNNNNSSSSLECSYDGDALATPGNKWKERALMNPFAKRQRPLSQPPPPPKQPEENEHESPVPIKASSPIPHPHSNAASSLSPRGEAPGPHPSWHSPPRNASRNGRHLATTPPALAPLGGDARMPTPQQLQHDPDDRLRALSDLSALRKSTTVLLPLVTASSPSLAPHPFPHPPMRDGDSRTKDSEAASGFTMRAAPIKRVTRAKPPPMPAPPPPASSQKKTAANSTMGTLAEIQRRREARRQAQAEEKKRIARELREHGDDTGYKFRRLIKAYRAALPEYQQMEMENENEKVAQAQNLNPGQAASSARLSVFVRKRPLARKELASKGYDVVSCLFAGPEASTRTTLVAHEPKLTVSCVEALEHHTFRFDGVFHERVDNDTIYASTVGPLLPTLVAGAAQSPAAGSATSSSPSVTVFAYGQTGSGKTFTMKAIYRQAASELFARLEALAPTAALQVGVSFYEIYRNNVNDLLNHRRRVQLLEDGDGVVQLLGLCEARVANAEALLALIATGEHARATSANAVHDESSRSHALLRVTLYSEGGGGGQGEEGEEEVRARLSMVDLAGSERAGDTQSDGKSTRMEGAEINKSLLALKECVRALDRGATHIPFRQSKLTQLLRDSFQSVQSKTVMIATVSPCSESCNHTLNTLRYADRLKEIGAND